MHTRNQENNLIIENTKFAEAGISVQSILESSPHWEMLTDARLNIIYCNSIGYQFLGITKNEFHFTTEFFVNHIHTQDVTLFEQTLQRALSGENHLKTLIRILIGQQACFQMELIVNPIYDTLKHVVACRITLLNKAKCHQTEDLILVNEHKYKLLFEKMPHMIIISNAKGEFIDANIAMLDFLGLESVAQLRALSTIDIYVNLAEQQILRAELAAQGFLLNRELQIKSVNLNKMIHCLLSVEILQIPNQEPIYISWIRDISKLKQTEIELKQSQKNLMEAQRLGNVGHWEYNHTSGSMFWSAQTFRILELNPELTQPNFAIIQSHVPPEEQELLTDLFFKLIHSQLNCHLEHRIMTQSGKIKYVIHRTTSQFNHLGQAITTLGTIQDITDLKKVENELIELNAAKNRFISVLAHDLKNPFSSLIGVSELIIRYIDRFDKGKLLELVNVIHTAANNTFHLLENLLYWARLQENRITLNPTTIHLKRLVEECFSVVSISAEAKKIELILDISPQTKLKADADMLRTVILNLITNAVKYTKENGTVTVSSYTSPTDIHIIVEDNGIGMNDDKLKNLFVLGKIKSERGTQNEGGTGFGLVLCKEFVEKHGGKIWVHSQINVGSKFHFNIPVT